MSDIRPTQSDRANPPSRLHQLRDRVLSCQPDHPLLIEPQTTPTVAGLQALALQVQAELQARGVGRGDRVLIVAENCAAHVALLVAVSRLGAFSCGLNARLSAGELAAFAQRAQARVVAYTVAASDAAAAHARAAGARASAVPGLHFGPVDDQALPEAGPLADTVAAIIFTSGTTGAPKGVLVSHTGLLHFASVSARARGLTAHDRVYACLPMTHIFGLATVLMATLQAGGTLLLRPRFEPDDLLHALAHQGLSQLQGPPTLFARLLAHLDSRGIEHPAAPALRYL
ncbi:MAG: o-succinylbenzoate--CoA ligase, partial [Burkholderiales bacterium PBB5]